MPRHGKANHLPVFLFKPRHFRDKKQKAFPCHPESLLPTLYSLLSTPYSPFLTHHSRLSMPPKPACLNPCEEVITLKEKVAALEAWKIATETDLKMIRDVISQVKLLMSLSIGGGALSIVSLLITIAALIKSFLAK